MKEKKKLGLGAIRVHSFVTSYSLERMEQKAVMGGSDRWYICGPSPDPTQVDCITSLCAETEDMAVTAPGAC